MADLGENSCGGENIKPVSEKVKDKAVWVKVPGGVKLTRSLKFKFEDPGVDCVFLDVKDVL